MIRLFQLNLSEFINRLFSIFHKITLRILSNLISGNYISIEDLIVCHKINMFAYVLC